MPNHAVKMLAFWMKTTGVVTGSAGKPVDWSAPGISRYVQYVICIF
jgi:hypothetical protein